MKTIEALIAAGEKATQGEWVDGNEALFTQAHGKGREWNGTVLLGDTSENILLSLTFAHESECAANDARFIAQAANARPAIKAMYARMKRYEEALENIAHDAMVCGEIDFEEIAQTALKEE